MGRSVRRRGSHTRPHEPSVRESHRAATTAIRSVRIACRRAIRSSISATFAVRARTSPGSGDRLVTAADIDGILDEIGAVDTGHDQGTDEAGPHPRARRLRRIREGQKIAGVCTGLAAYAELDVAWVRTLFVLGTLITAGILGLVYIALAFILPVASKREA